MTHDNVIPGPGRALVTMLQGQGIEVPILHLPPDMTDAEIDEVTRGCMPYCFKKGQGFLAAIGGYDDDERELYQVPEVKALCKRFVERGLISILEASTLVQKEEKPWMGGFLGAYEIWAMSIGLICDNGALEMDKEDALRFLKVLDASNKTAQALNAFKEGQHRTKAPQ